MKRALITGVNGMDGSHLADFLLEKGYRVFGLERRTSVLNRSNTSHLVGHKNFSFIQGDLTDKNSLIKALEASDPDEVYNLAAQSFVGASWNLAEYTTKVNALGVLNLLESIREYNKKIKVYQASTSEMFGGEPDKVPQNEYTPFHPKSPYAVAKLYAHWISKNFRKSYDMFICCGILFNHESERRGIDFVTRKITDGVAKIHSEILKKRVFKDFYEIFPEKFCSVTNGVTQRRWLLHCNPCLAQLITNCIGNEWITNFTVLQKFARYSQDEQVQTEIIKIIDSKIK